MLKNFILNIFSLYKKLKNIIHWFISKYVYIQKINQNAFKEK